MHLSAPERGLMATSAVVATTIPLAVGAALANVYRKSQDVAAVFFGDGAVEEGAFWESLNFASLRRLRVLFVCEDNGLAIHAPAVDRRGLRSIPEAVRGFECHVAGGDGRDVQGVIALTREILRRMREEPKPGFLHFPYFRVLEHVGPREDFDAGYRCRPAPEEMQRLDPVLRFETATRRNGCSGLELAAIRAAVDEQIDRSVRIARDASFPSPLELYTEVLA